LVNSTGAPSSLYGGAGDDLLIGRPGQDALIGDRGPDRLRGKNGNDLLLARDRTSDALIDCGAGPADRTDLDKAPKDPNFEVKGCERNTRH
jgi:Ca2+-binding RTX toxin-like protein